MLDDIAAALYAVPVDRRRSSRCSTLKPWRSPRRSGPCRARGWHVATAKSCTGGLVAAALTAIAGSSDVVERGFVAYSNKAKMELLGVPAETIAAHGAVSAQTAAAMARGAIARAGRSRGVGHRRRRPGRRHPQKPVGLVYLGIARKDGGRRVERRIFPGDRGGGAPGGIGAGARIAAGRGPLSLKPRSFRRGGAQIWRGQMRLLSCAAAQPQSDRPRCPDLTMSHPRPSTVPSKSAPATGKARHSIS